MLSRTMKSLLFAVLITSLGVLSIRASDEVIFHDQFNEVAGNIVAVVIQGSGTATPTRRIVVDGDNTSFRFTPGEGHRMASASGCNGTLDELDYQTGPITAACTITATFSPNQYTVSFDSSEGSAVSPITQDFGTPISAPADPTRVGYTFNGWSPSIPSIMPAENVKVSAQWQANQYTVSFDSSEGSAVSPITQDFGTPISAPADPTRVGYTFNGWSPSIPSIMPAENVKVSAQWQANQYTVSFDSSPGSSVDSISLPFGASIPTPNPPIRVGYAFMGWSPPLPETMPSRDLEVVASWELLSGSIGGQIQNYSSSRPAIVTVQSVGDLSVLRAQQVSPDGSFLFQDLDTAYQYSVEIVQPGYRLTPQENLNAERMFLTTQATKAGLSADKTTGKDTPMSVIRAAGTAELIFEAVAIPGLADNEFHFHWSEDVSVSGAEYMSYINEPLDIQWLDKETSDIRSYAAATLLERYQILLLDDQMPWSDEHAYRLLQMIERTGIQSVTEYPQDQDYPYASVWSLSEDALTNDTDIDWSKNPPSVTVSTEAFLHASPRIVRVEGKRGRFYSNRLFEVAVRFVTAEGTDMGIATQIIKERYGINVAKDSHFDGRYSYIPIPLEDRYSDVWQQFHADEVIELIAMLEEFPSGMRDLSFRDKPGGLRNILRRRNGLKHPWYPLAAAVAWPFSGHDYIEFMDVTFIGSDLSNIHRLIIHEKAHFIWAYLLSNDLKYEWLKKSGWYRANGGGGNCDLWNQDADSWVPPNVDPETLNALPEVHDLTPASNPIELEDGWASCSTTQFVSAYAAKLNPNEDMAESMATFLRNPDLLRSRALPKYEFIRDYIMQGTIYLSMIRPDLTFDVLNLYPDYVYPGKINNVDIHATGSGTEDKKVNLGLGIHTSDDCDSDINPLCFEGATGGYMRIFSPSEKAFIDTYINIEPGKTLSDKLSGSLTIPSDAEPGWWSPKSIITFDQVGNRRIEKLISNDYGWKLYINNTDPDLIRPTYVPHSMELKVVKHGDDFTTKNELREGEQELQLTWRVKEDRTLSVCFTRVIIYKENGETHPKLLDQYGDINQLGEGQLDGATHECKAYFKISRFMPKGFYAPGHLTLMDRSLERISVPFTKNHPTHEEPKTIWIQTPTPDEIKPVIDVTRCTTPDLDEQCLRVYAVPTQPENPNGETLVRLYYWAWDGGALGNASGVKTGKVRLRNPQGQEFFYWHYEATPGLIGRTPQHYTFDFNCPPYTLEQDPDCDAITKVQYVFETVLPEGSVPGVWGLSELGVIDHAGNQQIEQFTETLRFDVD